MKTHNISSLIISIAFIVSMVYIADLDKVVATLLLILAVLLQILMVVAEINKKI